jgi:hypothetical protein
VLKSYLQFLIKSKNEHSLHSPFLFDFYTKVVLDKSSKSDFDSFEKFIKKSSDFITKTSKRRLRVAQFIFRLIRYFDYNIIVNLNDSTSLNSTNSEKNILEKVQNKEHIDLVIFDESNYNFFELILSKIHENSCFVFDSIYNSDKTKAEWKTIKDHPAVMISIDFFWIGVVFFRKKQPKQHFVLRLR